MTLSLRVSTVAMAAAIAVLALASGVLGVLLWQARDDIADRAAAAAGQQRAEQVATDYAVGAATVDYQDFPGWVAKLKANTTAPLAAQFDATAPKLEQVLVPLQWTSTATPVAAKVEQSDNGVYKVDVFVSVTSTSAQSHDGAQTTVTYNVTLDSNADWKVTDVGGTNAALPLK